MRKKTKIFGFYPEDEDKFKGEYLVVVGKKILAHSSNCQDILPILKQFSNKALITKVPLAGWKEAMILYYD